MTDKTNKPGDGLWGWFGRQIGHVKKAVRTDVTQPAALPSSEPKVIFRQDKVEEVPHPKQPNVTLRRTVIDEMIVEEKLPQMNTDQHRSEQKN